LFQVKKKKIEGCFGECNEGHEARHSQAGDWWHLTPLRDGGFQISLPYSEFTMTQSKVACRNRVLFPLARQAVIRRVQTKPSQCLFLNAKHGKTASGQMHKYSTLLFLAGQLQGMKNY